MQSKNEQIKVQYSGESIFINGIKKHIFDTVTHYVPDTWYCSRMRRFHSFFFLLHMSIFVSNRVHAYEHSTFILRIEWLILVVVFNTFSDVRVLRLSVAFRCYLISISMNIFLIQYIWRVVIICFCHQGLYKQPTAGKRLTTIPWSYCRVY